MSNLANGSGDIQRVNAAGNAQNLIDLIAKLPIPGVAKVLDPISALFNFFETSALEEVLADVKHSNTLLENSYNVTMAALRIKTIQDLVDGALRDINSLAGELKFDERLGGYEQDVLGTARKRIDTLNDSGLQALQTATRFLEDFETATGAGSGQLIDLIGHYAYGITQALHCVSLAQYGMNMVQHHNALLQAAGKLTNADVALASRAARLSGDLYGFAQGFVEKDIPVNYPSWCRPIFLGEPASIGNVAKPGYRIGDYVYSADYTKRVAHPTRDGSVLCCLTKDVPAAQITIKLLENHNRETAEVWEIWQVSKTTTPARKWFTIHYGGYGMQGPPVLFNPHPKGQNDVYYDHWAIQYYEKKLVFVEAGSENALSSDNTAIWPVTYHPGEKKSQWYFL